MTAPPANSEKRKATTLKDTFIANLDFLKALDHTISIGVNSAGLASFLPEQAVRRLEEKRIRYDVPLATLPQAVQELSPGRVVRSCVETEGADGELEVFWGPERKILVLHCDRGSIGWPALLYLFSPAVGLRGDAVPDIAHRRNNSYLHAWHLSGF